MTTSDNLFDGFEIDEIAAYVFTSEGPEGLRGPLAHLVDTNTIDRQTLMEVADRLEDAGLSDGAALIMEAINQIADQAPSELERILDDPNRSNVKGRLRSFYQKSGGDPEILQYLSVSRADQETIAFVEGGIVTRPKRPGRSKDYSSAAGRLILL